MLARSLAVCAALLLTAPVAHAENAKDKERREAATKTLADPAKEAGTACGVPFTAAVTPVSNVPENVDLARPCRDALAGVKKFCATGAEAAAKFKKAAWKSVACTYTSKTKVKNGGSNITVHFKGDATDLEGLTMTFLKNNAI